MFLPSSIQHCRTNVHAFCLWRSFVVSARLLRRVKITRYTADTALKVSLGAGRAAVAPQEDMIASIGYEQTLLSIVSCRCNAQSPQAPASKMMNVVHMRQARDQLSPTCLGLTRSRVAVLCPPHTSASAMPALISDNPHCVADTRAGTVSTDMTASTAPPLHPGTPSLHVQRPLSLIEREMRNSNAKGSKSDA